MPGKTLFEAVSGALRDPERRLIAGIDLQPDPGDAEAAVGPRRGGPDGLRGICQEIAEKGYEGLVLTRH